MKTYTKRPSWSPDRPLPTRLSQPLCFCTSDGSGHDQPLRGPPASMCMPSPASYPRLSSPLRPAGLPTPPDGGEATSMALPLTLSPRSESANFPSGEFRPWPAAPFLPLCENKGHMGNNSWMSAVVSLDRMKHLAHSFVP